VCSSDLPFLRAAFSGHPDPFLLLLADPRIDINKPNSDLQSPIWRICFRGHDRLVWQLVASRRMTSLEGASSPDSSPSPGATPLHVAKNYNLDGKAVSLLVSYKDDPKGACQMARQTLGIEGFFFSFSFSILHSPSPSPSPSFLLDLL